MNIKKYSAEYLQDWNTFLETAKNRHFFFFREYMEYHSDRFQDFSLIFYGDNKKIIALLPCSIEAQTVISHGGLTFGGFIVGKDMSVEMLLKVFDLLLLYLKKNNIHELIYKSMPYIYHQYPSQEDLYVLFKYHAELIRRDVSSAIYLPCRYKYRKGRKCMIKRGYNYGFHMIESDDYDSFVSVLNKVLGKYHGCKAVHSAAELRLLKGRFSDNIHLYVAMDGERLMAGTLLFINGDVVHTQYMANSDFGREMGALDCLIDWLITDVYKDKKWFDFGISTEQQGRFFNTGLAAQKEGFGARAIVHDFYKINCDNDIGAGD